MTNYSEELLLKAFKTSKNNQEIISASKKCGCFFCCSVFATPRIREWHNKKDEPVLKTVRGASAVCPICESMTVVGDAVGVTMTTAFLEELANFAMPMIAAEYQPIKERSDAELNAELEEAALREVAELEEEEGGLDSSWEDDND